MLLAAVFAATPSWFADNVAQIAVAVLVVLTLLVVRLVQKAATRIVLLCVLLAMAVFVYVNQAPFKACARTCECSMAGKHITVPGCNPDLKA